MIKSFSCEITEKLFNGEALRRKEVNTLGNCDLKKAKQRLIALSTATEKELLASATSLHYHKLSGTNYYSIDIKRNSAWRILFQWEGEETADVKLVRLTTETHR